jgi:hypothetical protein
MPDPQTFEPRLADALRRYARRAPTDVDAMALAREIATTSTQERRRSKWWPFARNTQTQGRSRSMFTATRIAAVVTLVALGSGLALSGFVSGPGDEATGPPGAEAPLVGNEWAFFSGTRFGGSIAAGGERTVENGMDVRLGRRYTGGGLKTDDPRMNGTFTETSNSFSVAGGTSTLADGTGGAIWSHLNVIENEGGTWTCEASSLEVGEILSENGWCTGSGDYEGLRAYMVFVGFNEVAGYITSGDGPPLPEASAE